MLAVRRFSGGWFFPCRVDCTHQVALPPDCVAGDHLPCALQHIKRAFSLKEHSRVRLFKDDVASGKLDVTSCKDELGFATDNVSPMRFWMRSLPGAG